MKYNVIASMLVVFTTSFIWSQESIKITKHVFSSGASSSVKSALELKGTLGQPLIGLEKSTHHRAQIGFWWEDYTDRMTTATTPTEVHRAVPLLHQNEPNPFRGLTRISFTVPKRTRVWLRIIDLLGREIAVLMNDTLPTGNHEVWFDAHPLKSGIYLYQMETDYSLKSKKMIVSK